MKAPDPWTTSPIHLIDFEGTSESGIVELGVVTLHHGAITESYSRLCRATGAIPEEESRVHGIAFEDTTQSEPFQSDWERFVQLRRTGPLGAHHAYYEDRLLKAVWPSPPYCPDFIQPKQKTAQWGPWIDTCQLYRNQVPQLSSYKLSNLINTLGLQESLDQLAAEHCPSERCRYHCALYDALAAAVLLLYLPQLRPSDQPSSLVHLLLHSRPNPVHSAQQELF